ncbi:MAG: acetylxylan esterase [Lentisphaeria bacterium]|nr:acetylxylan esterase [Lentisphaeria bacterium]
MKKSDFILAAALLAGTVWAAPKTEPLVRAERESAVYKVGENIKFIVSGPIENVTYTVNDGKSDTPAAPLTSREITVKAEAPGFVLVTLYLGKDRRGRDICSFGGAAVEPEKIVAGTGRPDDFEQFWQNQIAQMRKSERKVETVKIDAKYLPEGFTGYDVKITQGDVIATGYLVMPVDAGKKSLPVVLNFNGASKVSAELPVAIRYSKPFKAISFNLNFHGLKNVNLTKKREYAQEKEMRSQVKNYQYVSGEDRFAYAMRKIFLRVVLAADYLQTLPEYNGKLYAIGGSLGGCQAIVCAALVPEVDFCVSNATAMCDHFGKDAGHLPGWPNLFAHNPKAAAAAAYFDVVNFAPMVKCPTRMAVGFVDVTCPPATTYAAYNALKVSDKKMAHTVTGGHGDRYDKKELGVFSHHHPELMRLTKKSGK